MGAYRFEASGLWLVRGLGVFVILCGFLLCPVSQARAQGDIRIPLNDAGIFDPGREPLAVGYELFMLWLNEGVEHGADAPGQPVESKTG